METGTAEASTQAVRATDRVPGGSSGLIRIWSERNPRRSAVKVGSWFVLTIALVATILHLESWPAILLAQFALGLVLAHGLELSHECLHQNMFRSRRLNRVIGVMVAAPFLVSFSQYKYQHLHHHRFVGTPQDRELVDYDRSLLDTPLTFLARAFNLMRIPRFWATLWGMLRGRYPQVLVNRTMRRDVLGEYVLLAVLFTAALAATIAGWTDAFLLAWFIPWLVFGELFHFLIELPEHLGCDKHDRDRFANTRSYRCPAWLSYLFNGNNFHVEHHLYPRVAVHNLARLNRHLDAERRHTLPSYREALRAAVAARRAASAGGARAGGAASGTSSA